MSELAIGEVIHNRRKKLGISLVKLAERAGTSASHVCAIEKGRVHPRPGTQKRLLEILGLEARTEIVSKGKKMKR